MTENKIITLYEHFKNTNKKLKIVCDWDEVIQAHEPYALWLALPTEQKENTNFLNYFRQFWSREGIIEYSSYGSKFKPNKDTKPIFAETQNQIKNSPDFYQQAPFLTIAEDLVKLIKEGKVERLIFLSAYDKKIFPNGDERKTKKFEETFGQIGYPHEKRKDAVVLPCYLELLPFDSEEKGQSKADWIKENAPDFDIVIDDNPNICQSIENYRIIKPCKGCMKLYMGECHGETSYSCGKCPRVKATVLAPYYPAIKSQHDERVLLVKQGISNLKKEDFERHE